MDSFPRFFAPPSFPDSFAPAIAPFRPPICTREFRILYLNRAQMIRYVDAKVTEYVLALLEKNVFPESEKVTLKRVKFRWNRVDVFDVYVGNCVSEEEEDDDIGALADEAATKEEKKEKRENAEKIQKTKIPEFSSPYFMRVQQISFKCSFFTLVPMMQFMEDKNFAVGFLSEVTDGIERRGRVRRGVERRGNFRVFKKKASVKLSSSSSSSEEEAKEDEAATTRGTNATGTREEEEDLASSEEYQQQRFIFLLSISSSNANRRREQEDSRGGE